MQIKFYLMKLHNLSKIICSITHILYNIPMSTYHIFYLFGVPNFFQVSYHKPINVWILDNEYLYIYVYM